MKIEWDGDHILFSAIESIGKRERAAGRWHVVLRTVSGKEYERPALDEERADRIIDHLMTQVSIWSSI